MGNAKSSRCYTLPIAPVKHDPLQPPKGPCDSAELVTSDNVKEGILSPGQADGFTKSKINAGNLEDAKAYYEEWCKSAGGTHIQFNGGDECLSLGKLHDLARGPPSPTYLSDRDGQTAIEVGSNLTSSSGKYIKTWVMKGEETMMCFTVRQIVPIYAELDWDCGGDPRFITTGIEGPYGEFAKFCHKYAMEYAGGPRESRKASLAIQNKTADGEPLKSGTCYDIYSSGNIRDYKAPGEFIGDNRVREAFADYVSSHLDETAGAVDLAALEAGAGPELELEDETAIDAVQAELAADAEAALLADA